MKAPYVRPARSIANYMTSRTTRKPSSSHRSWPTDRGRRRCSPGWASLSPTHIRRAGSRDRLLDHGRPGSRRCDRFHLGVINECRSSAPELAQGRLGGGVARREKAETGPRWNAPSPLQRSEVDELNPIVHGPAGRAVIAFGEIVHRVRVAVVAVPIIGENPGRVGGP